MAIQSTEVLPDNTLEEFRIEFNKLVTDVSGLSLGNTFDTQIIFEGDTDDTFETAISVTDPTADRSIVFPNQSGNVLLDSANITLANDIELQFGTDSDLKIFHNGSNSIIRDAGTGSLFLEVIQFLFVMKPLVKQWQILFLTAQLPFTITMLQLLLQRLLVLV